jgi:hypothetical protein
MSSQTAEQAKALYVEKMGEVLGSQFAALWQEIAYAHLKSNEFIELFGTDRSRIDLMNKTASGFFHMLQRALWEDAMLHIARITDSPKSVGKSNLTIRSLPELIDDEGTKTAVKHLIEVALSKASFCREWRKRHIAHRDLALALKASAEPLPQSDIDRMKKALAALADVLNKVQQHYTGGGTPFGAITNLHGATALLSALDETVKVRAARQVQMQREITALSEPTIVTSTT